MPLWPLPIGTVGSASDRIDSWIDFDTVEPRWSIDRSALMAGALHSSSSFALPDGGGLSIPTFTQPTASAG